MKLTTTEKETHVQLEDIQKWYGEQQVLKGMDLHIQQGEFVAIVGKSGCGKSTLLRLVAGLEKCTTGSIHIADQPLKALNKQARIMFQDGRLLPWKSVLDNVRIGLPKDSKEKAKEALRHVGLEGRMKQWPQKLSGGQQQRVALARALVHDPALLLLDEPLGALDAFTRMEMQELIESLWQQSQFTSILVTHDVEEAVTLADRVILIEDGQITMNQTIDLPRPRHRTNPAFSMYVEEVMGRIMNYKVKQEFIVEPKVPTVVT
ncbi:MAG TPA: ATP-binding cassette domain-containing protein [Virgibacillus sp.]|nr:ATP-binding cassette domain-containing protein [Virgibacillus sp.]